MELLVKLNKLNIELFQIWDNSFFLKTGNGKKIIHIFLSIFAGSIIYILFREKNLLMFKWFKFLKLDFIINFLRDNFYKYRIYIPKSVLFSLPDALWVYSFTMFLSIYFKNRIDSIDWNTDFEKADKENYEILDRLCECIKNELMKNQKSKILPEALLLLAENVGCAEDFERYEENFVNKLEEEGLLTKELSELFRQNTNRRQG